VHFFRNLSLMVKKILLICLLTATLALPVFYLQAEGPLSVPPPTANSITLTNIGAFITALLGWIWLIFVVLAIIMFIIAGAHFLLAQGDPGSIDKAKHMAIWGVVGVFVAILAFSIVLTVSSFFGGSGTPPPSEPAPTGACCWGQVCYPDTTQLWCTGPNKQWDGADTTCVGRICNVGGG